VRIRPSTTGNGPDIDAIVLVKSGYSYSKTCESSGTCYTAYSATPSSSVILSSLSETYGIPDAFKDYPSNTSCYYRRSASNTNSYTFATINANTIFTLSGGMNPGDKLYTFELSNCILYNAGTSTGAPAVTDSFYIDISYDKSKWVNIDYTPSGGVIETHVDY
jgi:hypothetical protein